MIVRILSEGQYRIKGADLDRLNDLDNAVVDAVEKNSEGEFRRLLMEMLDHVRKNGQPVPVEELVESDVILPYADITLTEAQRLFTGEGLIPER